MSTPEQPNQPEQYEAPQHEQPPHHAPQAAPAGLPAPGPGEPFDGATNSDDLSRPLYGASFGVAIKRFFKNYANFSGRASRSEFWWAQLFLVLIGIIPTILLIIGLGGAIGAILSAEMGSNAGIVTGGGTIVLAVIGGILYGIFTLATIIPTIAISWRRLHDANLPGTFWLLNLASIVPFLNYIGWLASVAFIVLTILPSKPEGRRFVSTK